MNRKILRSILLVSSLGLSACGGSGSGSGGSSADVHSPSETQKAASTTLLASGLVQRSDVDGDGIPDDIDPYPSKAPVDGALERPWLRPAVEFLGSANTVHAGFDAVLQMFQLDPAQAPYFAELHGGEDVQVAPLTLSSDGRMMIAAEHLQLPFNAVSVFNYAARSPRVAVNHLAADAPLISSLSKAVRGEPLIATGFNLASANLTLNGKALNILQRQASQLQVSVSEQDHSGVLLVSQQKLSLYEVPLSVHRHLRVWPEADLSALGDVFLINGVERLPFASQSVLVQRPTETEVVTLSRELASSDFFPLSSVAWPDQSELNFNTQSITEAAAYQLRGSFGEAWPRSWQEQRAWLEQLLEMEQAVEVRAMISEVLAGQRTYNYEWVRQRFMAAAQGVATSKNVLRSTAENEPRKKVTVGGDDEVVRNTASTPRTIFGRELYEHSINVRYDDNQYLPGRTFGNAFTVSNADSLTCFQPFAARAPGFTPADLCFENDGLLYASASVVVIDEDGNRSRERSHIAITPNPKVLSEITDFSLLTGFDADIVGPQTSTTIATVAFLDTTPNQNTEPKLPLCGMQRCDVEVLLGSFDQFGSAGALDANEKIIADALLTRLVTEKIVLPFFQSLTNELGSQFNAQCTAAVFTTLIRQSTAINDLRQKLSPPATRDQIIAELTDTIGKLVLDIVAEKGSTLQANFVKCLPGDTQQLETIFNGVQQAAKFRAGGTGLITIMKAVYDGVVAANQLFNTPRKIVFEVIPFIQVTDLSNNFKILEEFEEDNDAAFLSMSGEYLANDGSDGRDVFFPEVRIFDATGNVVSLPTTAQNFSRPQGMGQSEFSATLIYDQDALKAAGLDGLASGSTRVELAYSGYDVEDFPAGELLVPAGTSSFIGGPAIQSLEPQAMFITKTDRRLALQGFRLHVPEFEPDADSENAQVVFIDQLGNETSTSTIFYGNEPVFTDADREVFYATVVPDGLATGLYDIEVRDKSPQPKVLVRSTAQLLMASKSQLIVSLGDVGKNNADDSIKVTVLDFNDTVVSEVFPIEIPQRGFYSITQTFDIPAPNVKKLRIECVNPGDNDVCTYGLRILAPTESGLITGKLKRDGCHLREVAAPNTFQTCPLF